MSRGAAYISSWIEVLENDPQEIRASAVNTQKMSDWLLARERNCPQVEGWVDTGRSAGVEPTPAPPQHEVEAIAVRQLDPAERDASWPKGGLSR